MKANVVGDFGGDNLLTYRDHVTDTAPRVLGPYPINNVDGISFQLVTEADGGSNLTGTYKVEVSNNYKDTIRPGLGQSGLNDTAQWSDITSQFSPTITNPAGSPTNQYCQAYPLVALWWKLTFTPSAGAGYFTATYSGKGNR